MVQARITGPEREAPEPQGLRDGGHVILDCSGCGRKLVDVWVVNPDARDRDGKPFEWRGVAHCCFCGDKSFEKSWSGRFAVGPAALPDREEGDNDRLLVRLGPPEYGVNAEGKPLLIYRTAKEAA